MDKLIELLQLIGNFPSAGVAVLALVVCLVALAVVWKALELMDINRKD